MIAILSYFGYFFWYSPLFLNNGLRLLFTDILFIEFLQVYSYYFWLDRYSVLTLLCSYKYNSQLGHTEFYGKINFVCEKFLSFLDIIPLFVTCFLIYVLIINSSSQKSLSEVLVSNTSGILSVSALSFIPSWMSLLLCPSLSLWLCFCCPDSTIKYPLSHHSGDSFHFFPGLGSLLLWLYITPLFCFGRTSALVASKYIV